MQDGKTAGQLIIEKGNPNPKQEIVDTSEEMFKTYYNEVLKCAESFEKLGHHNPFYIVVTTKVEKALGDTIHNWFYARVTIPTPQWSQTVWRWSPAKGDLMLLWTLPPENAAKNLSMADPKKLHPHDIKIHQDVIKCLNNTLLTEWLMKYPEKSLDPTTVYDKIIKLDTALPQKGAQC